MGQFSYICKKSRKALHAGDHCYIFYLENGQVKEYMFGNYDTYGRVSGLQWKKNWSEAVNMHFSEDKSCGFAAILAPYWQEGQRFPKTRSKDDPHQGWGRRRNSIPLGKDYYMHAYHIIIE